MSEVERARAFVDRAYRDVDDGGESLAHVCEVGAVLAEMGCEPHVTAAGLLHDVVEDTSVTVEDVSAAFGERIGELVAALSEDETIDEYDDRKLALREAITEAGYVALVIFAADKLARLRAADRDGQSIEPRKLAHYRRSAEMFRAHGIRGPHLHELDRRLRARRPGLPPGPFGLPADP